MGFSRTGSVRLPLIIAGGGLSGCLAALALAKRRPDVEFLLIEQDERFGGNHIWSFFDSDIAAGDRWLVDLLGPTSWPSHQIRFPRRQRTLRFGYNSISSVVLDRVVRAVLKPEQIRLGRRIRELGPDFVELEGAGRLAAAGVIDARGPTRFDGLDLAWQKFVGRTYRFAGPHGRSAPLIMDATVPQIDGYRFVYSLPFTNHELMVEDTYYSDTPSLDVETIRGRLDSHVRASHGDYAGVGGEETGVLPILLAGAVETLWPARQPVARLGLRGGFFHPTTGYSLPDAVRNAMLLVRQRDLSGAALHALFSRRAAALWKERGFFQLLNRMLFRAAAPEERYRVLEHFYRLPEPLIARFYAGSLTGLDKMRILSGRPPVPIGRAVAAMRVSAA